MTDRGRLRSRFEGIVPGGLLSFLELRPFTRLWSQLGLTDDDLLVVQLTIMCDPEGAPVIPDCGGVRKLRFAPLGSGKGKRGSMRCCYKFFEDHKLVILGLVYPKSVQENLSSEDKHRIRAAMKEIEAELEKA